MLLSILQKGQGTDRNKGCLFNPGYSGTHRYPHYVPKVEIELEAEI
jgi:hypothetical protein